MVAIVFLATTVNAQGVLGKLKEKAAAAGVGGGSSKVTDKPSEAELKAAEEDKADTYLNSKTINKDPNNVSGIYYSNRIIVGVTPQRKSCVLQKFLLNFENSENGLNYTLNHRFSYEEKNGVKVPPVYLNVESFSHKVRKKAGIMALYPDYDAANFNYAHVGNQYSPSINNSGEAVCPTQPTPEVQRLTSFYFIEDGIFVMMPGTYEGRDFEKNDCFSTFQQYCEPVIFFKKEKEARAAQLTAADIHKRMAQFGKAYINALDKGVVGWELPRPGDASASSLWAEPKGKVLEVFKQYLEKEGMSNYVPLYAYVHFDHAEYSDIMIPHPLTGVQVKNGRIVDFIVVCKNTLTNNDGKNADKYVTAKNVFFHINFAENVKDQQYNTENYTGKWYIYNCSIPSMGVVDENEDPMKYKGK